MFGQDNQQDQQPWQPASDPTAPQSAPAVPDPVPDDTLSGSDLPGYNSPTTGGSFMPPSPSDTSFTPPAPSDSSTTTPTPTAGGTTSTDDLLSIKQDALQQLSPLVQHLDQSPEEKFRTTMMMIQASDDQSLLQTAYDLAKQIPDEKVKAQALLDVVNEINYFTQQHHQE